MIDKPHLVLVPGFLCDEAVWAPQLPALRRRATVQVAEHGLLDSLGAMAEAIIVHAPQRFAIAGHSMGGRVAMEVFRRVPQRVTHMALLDTGCHALPDGEAGERERQARMALLATARNAGMRAMATLWVQGMVHPDRLSDRVLIGQIVDMLARRTPQHQEAQTTALLRRASTAALLQQLRCPTLVLCGREDRSSSLEQHIEMAGLVRGAELVVLDHCGHMCTMEHPADLAQQLTGWLDK